MGCRWSKHSDAGPSSMGGGHSAPISKSIKASTPASGTDGRIDAIPETRQITMGGLTVRYAYLSQRGYYPEDANKANQDAYSVTHDFCKETSDAFFGVYDGHGRDGDRCSQFARDKLPEMVEKQILRTKNRESKTLEQQLAEGQQDGPALELTKDQVQTACLKAHVECNREMHRCHTLDDSLSGTTAISVFVHGRRNRITVCNVGDSRAILGQEQKPEGSNTTTALRAMPLSRDQTPYRRDERIRVKKTGARILSLDQIEGLEPIEEDEDDDENGDLELGEELDEGGDPPRVWSPHGEYPGTAFTRSLGDAIAEEFGVFAEPEMLTRELTQDDKIIVLASDGVYEFLTNQSVIDLCAKFSDPLEACRAVVAESYELWLQYEMRTDDITIICMFVDSVQPVSARHFVSVNSSRQFSVGDHLDSVASLSSEADVNDPFFSLDAARPVRNQISKEKYKHLQKLKSDFSQKDLTDEATEIEKVDLDALFTEKTDEEKAGIAEAIRASVMFKDITDEQREIIYGVMESISVKKGTWIIKQGTVGDRFYIIDTGRFEVRIVQEDEKDDGKGGKVVHLYEGSRETNAHPSFGELALMYSAPRAASVVAQTDGKLWALHRYAFRQVLNRHPERTELVRTLGQVDVLSTVEHSKLKALAKAMKEVKFARGETIVEEGQAADALYVVYSGACDMVKTEGDKAQTTTLRANDSFGEEVVTGTTRYTSTVVALQATTCWKLDKATLNETVGSKSGMA